MPDVNSYLVCLNKLENLQNVKMKISHPRFLIPGNIEDLSADFPRSLGKQTTSEGKDVPECIMEKSRSHIFSFPEVS